MADNMKKQNMPNQNMNKQSNAQDETVEFTSEMPETRGENVEFIPSKNLENQIHEEQQ